MANPFEGLIRRLVPSEKKAEPASVASTLAPIEKSADQLMLERGQMEAHMTTLYRFSPEAAKLVIALKDPDMAATDFVAGITGFNERHKTDAPAAELLETFAVPVAPGRSIDVSLYKTGRVVLEGTAATVH
ncbi:MAG: hypothetical protein WDN10_01655 [bacterium]